MRIEERDFPAIGGSANARVAWGTWRMADGLYGAPRASMLRRTHHGRLVGV